MKSKLILLKISSLGWKGINICENIYFIVYESNFDIIFIISFFDNKNIKKLYNFLNVKSPLIK